MYRIFKEKRWKKNRDKQTENHSKSLNVMSSAGTSNLLIKLANILQMIQMPCVKIIKIKCCAQSHSIKLFFCLFSSFSITLSLSRPAIRFVLIAHDYVHNEHNWGHNFCYCIYFVYLYKCIIRSKTAPTWYRTISTNTFVWFCFKIETRQMKYKSTEKTRVAA